MNRLLRLRGPLLLLGPLLALASCSEDLSPALCELRVASSALSAENRNIVGTPGNYNPDLSLRVRAQELRGSQQKRRQVAWQSVAKLLRPIDLSKAPPALSEGVQLPLWQSFYGSDEVKRLFQHLFTDLSTSEKSQRQRFTAPQIDEAFGWNVSAVEELDNWPLERREAYLAAIDSLEKLSGIPGADAIGYSSDAVRHMLTSYPDVLDCMAQGVPDAVTDSPGDSLQQSLRQPLQLVSCQEEVRLGPFFVSEGESLRATLSPSADSLDSGAVVSIHADTGNSPACTAQSVCEATGEPSYTVHVLAGAQPFSGAVQVDYRSPNADWSPCLQSPFPQASVVVKANWKRIFASNTLPTYQTSAQALEKRLENNSEDGWTTPDGQADPDATQIYTMALPNGQRYRLAGLHIMTKELDHWQWITLWWSSDPNRDFGEDRPSEITELGGPWSHYKMCAVSFFDEGDIDPTGGYSQSAPTLAAALASVYKGVGQPSWCSNPYIEEGAHNMATNCIGCHQHGGTDLQSEDIISAPLLFPNNGRSQIRNTFPHDYSWALSAGEKLQRSFKEVVEFFDTGS